MPPVTQSTMGDSLSDTEEIDKEDPTQAVPCAGGPDVGGRAAEREGLGDLLVPACLGVVMAGLRACTAHGLVESVASLYKCCLAYRALSWRSGCQGCPGAPVASVRAPGAGLEAMNP